MRKTIVIVQAFLIAALISCEGKQDETPDSKAVPVEVAPVRLGIIAKEIKFTGSIEASTEVQVYPKITATIEEMKVDSGDSINKGEVIALLESDELQAQPTVVIGQHLGAGPETDLVKLEVLLERKRV